MIFLVNKMPLYSRNCALITTHMASENHYIHNSEAHLEYTRGMLFEQVVE